MSRDSCWKEKTSEVKEAPAGKQRQLRKEKRRMENRDLNEHSDQDSSFSRSQDFSIPFSFPTLSLAFLALSNVCLGVKERIIARQRQLEARKTRRLKDMPKLISFFGCPYLIRSNFIKTTYDISLDSWISFLPLGFSPTL
jgi:hypothetical protein